jgi:hypothetical protein
VIENPTAVADDIEEPQLRRVCDTCIPQVLRLSNPRMDSPPTPPTDVPPPSVSTEIYTGNPATSEINDMFLIECPVCRMDLRAFGDEDLQAIHVATCLEDHGTSPSFSGGSRHLGKQST